MISFPQTMFMAQMENFIDKNGNIIAINKNFPNPFSYKQFFSNLAQYLASIDPNIESINLDVSINMKDGTSYNGF